MAKLQTDLREFIALLNSRAVEYLIVGGHAVAFHGHPRFTGDIDFFVRTTAENAQRLLSVLNAFGFGDVGITAADLLTPDKVIQLGRPPNRIDMLTSISGVDFESAWSARVEAALDGQRVCFLGWNDLLRNKNAADRPQDRADVEKLLAIARRKGAG
ncbi:MAG: nucleotidyltransferase [bacterium]